MGRFTNSYTPLEFVVCVRVSCVCSLTRVTRVSATEAPEESVTAPVIPPSVCWASSAGTRRSALQQKMKASEKNKDFLLLIMQCILLGKKTDLPQLGTCSQVIREQEFCWSIARSRPPGKP